MSDPFIGQIALFGFNFAPKGWALCEGQLLPLSQNTALFSILGTTYGGDGKSTFALPDLRGRVAPGAGQGPGLSGYDIGESGGAPTVALLESEMPVHAHGFVASTAQASEPNPGGNLLARVIRPAASAATHGEAQVQAPGPTQVQANFYSSNPNNANAVLAPNAIGGAGGNAAHNNVQPSLALNFCIALQGVLPTRP
jgi:microcystin-dependent protein